MVRSAPYDDEVCVNFLDKFNFRMQDCFNIFIRSVSKIECGQNLDQDSEKMMLKPVVVVRVDQQIFQI